MFTDITVKGADKKIPWQQAVALYAIHRRHTSTGKEGSAGRDGGGLMVSGSLQAGTFKPEADTEENTEHSLSRLADLMQMMTELASDPKLFGLQKRLVLSEQIDYSNISRYLHLAEFTPDHVIMLDKAPTQKLAMHHSADDLVGIVCWLARDIDDALGQSEIQRDELANEVRFLAENFADRYLSSDETLVSQPDQAQRADLIERLEHIFQEIMRWHPPVDALTQEVADVVEAYLTMGKIISKGKVDQSKGDTELLSGAEWFDLWEMLCLDNELETALDEGWKVLIVDAGNLPDFIKVSDDVKAAYEFTERGQNQSYFGNDRPDLIVYKEVDDAVQYRIIDFKYYDYNELLDKQTAFTKKSGDAYSFYFDESKNDIQKSQSYAFGVQQFHMENHPSLSIRVSLEFWVAAGQQDKPIEVFNPYQLLQPKPIQTMIETTLSKHKAFAR